MTAKEYFIYLTLGSVAVNGALNVGFALLKRKMDFVPLWGSSGIAFDTLTTTFMLSALTVLFGTVSVRHDLKTGRIDRMSWTPEEHHVLRMFSHSSLLRALAFGPLFTGLLVPPTIGIFMLAHVVALTYWQFFAFKVVYAVVLGMIVTPLNALWAMTRANGRGEAHSH